MALDTKQKRGSAMEVSMPHRQWLANPDGTLTNTDRVSLLKFCSAIVPTVVELFAEFYGRFRGRLNVASVRRRVYVPNK